MVCQNLVLRHRNLAIYPSERLRGPTDAADLIYGELLDVIKSVDPGAE